MSEPKRATFSTISTQKSNVKKVKEVSKTIRFSLTLPESNEKTCPEYNYRDLLNSVEKKNRLKDKNLTPTTNGLNILDPFDDDDDDVKRIARQFEEKYGGIQKPTKRKGKKDDYADIGAGYDESDSFIDNTDAYDEMVPEDVTTLHGGFYINSGALEFKQVELSASEDESSDSSTPEKTVSRKRVIEDSDSESDEDENEEEVKPENPDKKQKIETNGVPKQAKKRVNIDDKEQIVKKKKVEEPVKKSKNATVKELLREKREEFNLTSEAHELGIDKENNKVSSSNTINDIIESVVNAGRNDNTDETSKESSSTDDVAVVSATSESESSRDEIPTAKSSTSQPATQPSAVQSSTTQPAVSQPPVSQPPVSITSVPQPSLSQPSVPQPPTLPITKPPTPQPIISQPVTHPPVSQTVSQPQVAQPPVSQPHVTHSNAVDMENHTEALKHEPEIITKLPEKLPNNVLEIISEIKKAAEHSAGKVKFFSGNVNTMFLNLEIQCRILGKNTRLQVYEHLAPFVKCKKDTLMRRAKNLLLDAERSKMKEPLKRLKTIIENLMPKVIKNYEKELQKSQEEMYNTDNTDPNKIRRVPKKRFPWTEEAKKILHEIVTIKKKCYTLEGIRKETFEDHLETFLKIGVICLWPEGWMTIATLLKQVKLVMESSNKSKSSSNTSSHKTGVVQNSVGPQNASVVQNPPVVQTTPAIQNPAVVQSTTVMQNTSVVQNTTSIQSIPPVQSIAPLPPIPPPPQSISVSPITLDTHAPNGSQPFSMSPVKNNPISPPSGHISGITVIPIPQTSKTSPQSTSASTSVPKVKHNSIGVKSSELSVSVNKGAEAPSSTSAVVQNPATEITPVTNFKDNSALLNSLNVNTSKSSVTITSVDLRTNSHNKDMKSNENVTISPSEISKIVNPAPVVNEKPKSFMPQITEPSESAAKNDDDCQIIDLTETPSPVVRKPPAPKNKPKYPDPINLKSVKRNPEPNLHRPVPKPDDTSIMQKKTEEITGTQAINHVIPGLKFASNLTDKKLYKDNQSNEDEMEQVMKNLKELQQMQEHLPERVTPNVRKSDVDIMSPSSSPVSVIAYNSSFSPKVPQPSDLSTSARERKADGPGFQDIFQKHLFQEVALLKQNQNASSVYNSNVQPKSNYNSIDNFNYARSGSIPNPFSNHRFPQNSNKFNASINNLQPNPAGTTNHTDDFALFSNLLYQYGYHSTSGSKQKSPP